MTENDIQYGSNYGFLWQISQEVTYQHWTSSYPYDRFKYVGEVNDWAYTVDFSNFYLYDSSYLPYLNPDYPQFTHIWVKMPSYTPHAYWLQRGATGIHVPLSSCSNGYCHYIDSNSQDITRYEMVTQIVPPEGGTTDLYNTVTFNRRNY